MFKNNISMVDLKPIGQHLECFLIINPFRVDVNLIYISMLGLCCWFSFGRVGLNSAFLVFDPFSSPERNSGSFTFYGTTF